MGEYSKYSLKFTGGFISKQGTDQGQGKGGRDSGAMSRGCAALKLAGGWGGERPLAQGLGSCTHPV
jgi:hypothetical protein